VQVGDLILWKVSGQVCIYLGVRDNIHLFHSADRGIVESYRRKSYNDINHACEVISESR
jgi:hypothetical protein